MPKPTVPRDFARHAEDLPGVEPDVIETLVEFKESYFDDPDPTQWRVDVLTELMLGVLPRKVTAPEDWFAAVVPTARAYIDYLESRGQLARGSDSAGQLLAGIDQVGDGVVEAARDPRNFGMAKAIVSAVGLDPSAADPARAAMEAFNALPDEQRAAILDPALRHFDPDDALGPNPFGEPLEDPDKVWPPLPLTWLPPATELAAAVRGAPLVRALVRLVEWNGAGHRVTRQEALTLPVARRACADLGLPLPATAVRSAHRIPALHRLWSLAGEHGLLDIVDGSAVRGEAAELLTDPDSDAEAVLGWWSELFDGCLTWGLDAVVDPEADDDADDDLVDAIDDLVTATLTELYPGTAVSASGLVEALVSAVDESYDEATDGYIDDLPGFPREELREQALRRWTAHLDQLVELGAAMVEDGELALTPLGRAGVRVLALAHGSEAPLIDDAATTGAATLLDALPLLGDAVAEPLIAAWSAPRTPERATDELLDAARDGTALARMTAVAVLMETYDDHVSGAARPRLEALRDDPVLGMSAHILLAGRDAAPNLPPHLRQWAVLEGLAVAVDSGALDDEDTAGQIWEMVDADADLDTAWRSPHPQLIEILDAVATQHPKGRTRKAAKKALFKARQREDLREDLDPGDDSR